MFRLNRNERSHWSGNGVHVESELVFMTGRNMHKISLRKHNGQVGEVIAYVSAMNNWSTCKTVPSVAVT